MTGEVVYRTRSGNITTAITTPLRDPRSGQWMVNQATVKIIEAPGGKQLLLGILAEWEYVNGGPAKSINGDVKDLVFSKCIEQLVGDLSALPFYALLSTEQSIKASFPVDTPEWGGVCVAIQDNHLTLARRGSYRVLLIRKGRLYPLTHTHPQGRASHSSSPTQPDLIFHESVEGGEKVDFVDSEIYLPGTAGLLSLDLMPGDGILLSKGDLMTQLTTEDGGNLLHRGFLSLYMGSPLEVTANSLARFSAGDDPEETRAVVVVKTEENPPPPNPPRWRGSCLWQVGILFAILIVSAALGLGAAYGIPRLMNSNPVPVTGAGNAIPPGFFSVQAAGNGAQYAAPNQSLTNMAPGALIDAAAGTQIRTAQSVVKIKLSDGTLINISNSTEIMFISVASNGLPGNLTGISLAQGSVLVDDVSDSTGETLVTTPDEITAKGAGTLFGVTYLPDQGRFDVDCLGGACKLIGPTTSRDLQAGQHSYILNGVIAGVDSARVADWSAICGSLCSQPIPAPTPAPYLGSGNWQNLFGAARLLSGASSGKGLIPGFGLSFAGFLAFGLMVAGVFRLSWAFIRLIREGEEDEDETDDGPPEA